MTFLPNPESPEAIAYNLMIEILQKKPDQDILEVYKKCLQAVTNPYDLATDSE